MKYIKNSLNYICITLCISACYELDSETGGAQDLSEKLVSDCLKNRSAVKPDLVISDIYKKPETPYYYYVKYLNIGAPSNEGDFLISISSEKDTFPGNPSYRFPIPKPCIQTETGGFSVGLIGVSDIESAKITAVVDWENRVLEENEENNTMTKTVEAQ